MEKIKIELAEEQYIRLNADYPRNGKSSIIGERSVEIVKWHFRSNDKCCNFIPMSGGCDLRIISRKNSKLDLDIEIKGTANKDIAWSQLKVSGNPSYYSLTNNMPLHRVCDVYSQSPVIYVLRYSDDFEMIPEPRWSLKPLKKVYP